MIAEYAPLVHGFDSFEGLPEHWRPGWDKGHFALSALPQVKPNVTLHVGGFEQTLPGFCAQHGDNLAFLHFDGDLYSSAKTVLAHLGPRIVPGTVIQFDDYLNYPGWIHSEHRAFTEFVEAP